MTELIPILSLCVAALAVFVGPFVTVFVTKRQIASSLEIANRQIVAPMRQAWINSLRDLLAELAGDTLHYHLTGYEDRSEPEYRRLALLEHKISLMLNPLEADHQKLEALIRSLVSCLERQEQFPGLHQGVVEQSRRILKTEWNRVRESIPAR